jgi:hypothetical protein
MIYMRFIPPVLIASLKNTKKTPKFLFAWEELYLLKGLMPLTQYKAAGTDHKAA